jgi:hypothetical protein
MEAAAGSGKGSGTIVVESGLLDMSNPEQADALGKAISDLTGRDIIVRQGRGA